MKKKANIIGKRILKYALLIMMLLYLTACEDATGQESESSEAYSINSETTLEEVESIVTQEIQEETIVEVTTIEEIVTEEKGIVEEKQETRREETRREEAVQTEEQVVVEQSVQNEQETIAEQPESITEEQVAAETPAPAQVEQIIVEEAPAPEPAPVATASDTMVWQFETGSKYHSINDCGRMNPSKAIQITETEAINRGLGKCSKCW